jgi:predicted nucleic acid-binding protein
VSVVLDTGALIAVERGDPRMVALLDRLATRGEMVVVASGVVAQAWRGSRQARLARLLGAEETEVVALDEVSARAIGVLLARSGTSDVIDGQVALVARQRDAPVISSDLADLLALDPGLRVHRTPGLP